MKWRRRLQSKHRHRIMKQGWRIEMLRRLDHGSPDVSTRQDTMSSLSAGGHEGDRSRDDTETQTTPGRKMRQDGKEETEPVKEDKTSLQDTTARE
mmetsp:Transcript_2020/g.4667  ORF Transcript_2020/g.4667 Transcript_2020/m.4667 type:complete len:95 (-) Transcript_2020:567-851(-)